VASTLNNLGNVAYSRGDLARAEQYYQQALAIFEKLAPNSLDVATTLNNLGNVARNRGDLARAEQYYQQALAIYEKLAPNSLDVAVNNLGTVAYSRGDLARAEQLYQQALAIYEKNLPPTRWMWQARSTIWGMWLILVATWRVRSSCISRRWRFTKNLPTQLAVA
jgi:tetratricopeptide (TPR) repeat protein